MTVRCLAYRLLDRFRHTRLATRFVYHGVPVQTIRAACTVVGHVLSVPESAQDGDLTFGLTLESGEFRHCEVTPCADAEVKAMARSLVVGDRVSVSGEERYDPAHVGGAPGWREIHPVTGIQFTT